LTAVQRPRPDRRPADADAAADVRTYHGTPVLQEPAWTWEVPWYLFTGGLAGASLALGVVARATGHEELARRVGWVAFASSLANPVLLVKDLGRPARFLHMLRVLRPSSAMSVGSWTLAAYSTAAGAETILGLSGRLPRVRGALALAEGAMGLPMSTYTGVLVADSSIPVWHEARHDLPLLFAASDSASAAASFTIFWSRSPPSIDTGVAAPMAVPGAMAATWAANVMMAPADAARAPWGLTCTITGTEEPRISRTMRRIEVSRPPGVSMRIR
jgi:formate-dependent nitrite reductase membrane component NrfD